MKKFVKIVVASILLILLLLWGTFQLDYTQKLVRNRIGKVAEQAGLIVSYDNIELSLPFRFRITDLLVTSKTGDLIISCPEVTCTPLLIDLLAGHCTIIALQARNAHINIDNLPASTDETASSKTFSILHFSCPSLSIKSSKLPDKTAEVSVYGKASLQGNTSQASCSLVIRQEGQQAWPKKLSLIATKNGSSIAFKGSCNLYGGVGDFIFSKNDTLSFSGETTLSQSHSTPIQKATCKWAIATRALQHALPGTLFLEHSITGKGSLSYDSQGPIKGTIEAAQIQMSFKKPYINNTLIPTRFQRLSIQGTFCAMPQTDGSCQIQASLSSKTASPTPQSCSLNVDVAHSEGHTNASFSGNLFSDDTTFPFQGNLTGLFNSASPQADLTLTSPFLSASAHFQKEDAEKSIVANIRCLDLSVFCGEKIKGEGEIFAQMALKGDKIPLSLMIRSSNLSYRDAIAQDATLTLSTPNIPTDPSTFRFEAAGLRRHNLFLTKAHGFARYNPQDNALCIEEVHLLGAHNQLPFDLIAGGSCSRTNTASTIRIESLQGSIDTDEVHLLHPIQIDFTQSTLTQANASIQIGNKCRIIAKCMQPVSEATILEITVDSLPLSHLAKACDAHSCSGGVSGFFAYKKTSTDLQAKLHLEASRVRYGVIGGEGSEVALGVTAAINDNILSASCCAAGAGIKDPLLAEVFLPITTTKNSPWFSIDPTGRLQGTLRGSLHISEFLTSWITKNVHIEGIILGDLSVGGSFSNPSFQGPLLLKHGRIDIPATSQVIDNIEMTGRIDRRTITVDSIRAQDEKNGSLMGTGLLTIDETGHFSWQAELACHEMEIVSLAYAKTSAGGTVRLCGDSSSLQITGEAISNNAVVDLAARFPESIPEMNISYKDEATPTKNPYTVTLNLGVDGGNGLTIRGNGLSSQWKGSTRIFGNTPSLQMKGILRCTQGSFMLGSRELHITEGTISVHGNLFTDSQLHIVATTNLPSTDASVCLSGSLAFPKLSLQSTPMKSENEILSLILFNKEYGDISPLESLQLAQTALRIRQTKSPLDFIEKMKASLGIDVLDVNTSNAQSTLSTTLALDPSDTDSLSNQPQNDVSLRVGKYISQGVAVVVSKDVTSDTNRLGVEAHVADNVTAAAEIGDDETSVVSLRWKKDY